jgi:transmembrane sensor
MDLRTDHSNVPPSRQADLWWCARLEAPDDAELHRKILVWRQASPGNEAAWQRVERLNQLTAKVVTEEDEEWQTWLASRRTAASGTNLIAARIPRRRSPVRRHSRWLAAATGLAIAAVVAFLGLPAVLLHMQADYTTSTAELRTIDLEDGTTVTLAAASAVAVSYTSTERRLSLLEGEALFQVKRDPDRPFRVFTGEVRTTVLGTVFDVRRAGKDVTVGVQEGVVDVSVAFGGQWPAGGERLEAGDTISVDSAGTTRRGAISPSLVGAWRQGQLLAQYVTLRDAVDQLRRSFKGSIILTDASLGDLRITGAYTLGDPEAALRAIARAHGAVVRRVTPWILMISAS